MALTCCRIPLMIALFMVWTSSVVLAEEMHTGDTWWRLREIQSRHSPELSGVYENINADLEEGNLFRLAYRRYVRNDLSFWGDLKSGFFSRENTGSGSQRAHHLRAGLVLHRAQESLRIGVSLSERGNLGLNFRWLKPFGPYLRSSLNAERMRTVDSYDGALHGEHLDRLELQTSFDPPSPIFLAHQMGVEQRTLMHSDRVHGHGHQMTWLGGLRFSRRPDRKVGWQFYDPELQFESNVYEYLELSLQKRYEFFSAGDAFVNRIARTSKSEPLTLGVGIGLPMSRKLALAARVNTGEDRERQLDFGKVLSSNLLFLIVLKNKSQIVLNLNQSSENVGNIRGDVFRTLIAYQVNL